MSKSAELRNKILASRKESIWQLGLVRMFRDHQVAHSRQFHLEQPQVTDVETAMRANDHASHKAKHF